MVDGMKRRSIRIVMMLLAASFFVGCDDKKAGERPPTTAPAQPLAVRGVEIGPGSIDQTVEIVGTLYGEEEAIISSKSSGRIVAIKADLGDRVSAGAVLAQVD